jgi:molybdenum cofactor cytidylyltransferase
VIPALLLAAGSSRRFGSPKLLQQLNGRAIVRWSAEALREPAVDAIVVVTAPALDEAIRDALGGIDARYVVNERASAGMGASLACGVAALGTDAEAAIVCLADEPFLNPVSLRRVVERYRRGGAAIVAPTYAGVRGHPVLFDRSVFPELLALNGDHGARAVTDRDPARLALIELGERKPIDVDTPEDLARLVAVAQNMSPRTSATNRP